MSRDCNSVARFKKMNGQQWKSGDWADVPPQQQIIEPVNTKLSVVLPFIESEIPNVRELLNRSIELSGQIPRVLFLVPFKGVNYVEVKKLAEKAFSQVGVIEDSEGVTSDWQGRQLMRNAAGPNSLFRQAAWFYYLHKQYGSWLWLEPDCVPITARWFYDLETEHFQVGRPFSGVAMAIGDQKRYMNGVAIYPWNAIQYAPLLVQSTMWKQHPEYEVGFDVAGGDDVLRHAHMTKLIQLTNHLAKGNVNVRPETVLCHGRIDLSAVPVLAESQTVSGVVVQVGSGEARDSNDGLRSRTDIGNSCGGAQIYSEGTLSGDIAGEQSESDKVSNNERGVKKSGMGTDQRTNPPPAQIYPEGGDATCQAQTRAGLTVTETSELIGSAAPTFDPNSAASDQRTNEPDHASSQTKHDGMEYGAVSKEIRLHVNELLKLWDDQPHRKVLIVRELRRAKLVPKHFR